MAWKLEAVGFRHLIALPRNLFLPRRAIRIHLNAFGVTYFSTSVVCPVKFQDTLYSLVLYSVDSFIFLSPRIIVFPSLSLSLSQETMSGHAPPCHFPASESLGSGIHRSSRGYVQLSRGRRFALCRTMLPRAAP